MKILLPDCRCSCSQTCMASWSPGIGPSQGNVQMLLCPNLFPNFSQGIHPGGRFARLVSGNSCLGKPCFLLLEKAAWLIILIACLDWGRLPVVRLREAVRLKIWRSEITALRQAIPPGSQPAARRQVTKWSCTWRISVSRQQWNSWIHLLFA